LSGTIAVLGYVHRICNQSHRPSRIDVEIHGGAEATRRLGVEIQFAKQAREGNLGIAADSDRRMRPHAALAAGNDKAIPRKDRLGFVAKKLLDFRPLRAEPALRR
jgi:hypothetical protein